MPKARLRTVAGRPGRGGVFVDSGAWIALVRANDAHHAATDALFRRALEAKVTLVTSNLVIAEVHRFLLFHAGIRPASLVLERMHASRSLVIEFATARHDETARRWLAKLADQRISYTDAVSFAIMQARHCTTALSFDRDFVVAGFDLWR